MTKLKLKGNSKSFKKTASSINRRELNTAMSEMTSCNSGINPIKGYISLPSFNSTTGQKEDFYGLYISDGELTVDTVTNVKEQINSFCTDGGTPPEPQALRLTFDSIENADALVGDASNVNDWNTFFDLPTNGNPYTSVTISDNTVILSGGSNVILTNGESYDYGLFANNENIVEVYDNGTVIGFGEGVFYQCINLTSAEFLGVTTIGNDSRYVFATDYYPMNLSYISFPNLISAGNRFFAYVSNVIGSVDCVFNLPLLQIAGEACFSACSLITTIDLPLLTTAGSSCFDYNTSLINVNLPNLITGDANCFYYCPSLVIIDLPLLTTAGSYFFRDCFALTNIDLPSCTDLGGTVADNNVFIGITGNTITLTVPSALMTADAGNPDGDIAYLQANNTVTIVTV